MLLYLNNLDEWVSNGKGAGCYNIQDEKQKVTKDEKVSQKHVHMHSGLVAQ